MEQEQETIQGSLGVFPLALTLKVKSTIPVSDSLLFPVFCATLIGLAGTLAPWLCVLLRCKMQRSKGRGALGEAGPLPSVW